MDAAHLTGEMTPYLETVATPDCFSSNANAALIFLYFNDVDKRPTDMSGVY